MGIRDSCRVLDSLAEGRIAPRDYFPTIVPLFMHRSSCQHFANRNADASCRLPRQSDCWHFATLAMQYMVATFQNNSRRCPSNLASEALVRGRCIDQTPMPPEGNTRENMVPAVTEIRPRHGFITTAICLLALGNHRFGTRGTAL